MSILLVLLLGGLTLLAISLLRTYGSTPLHELKRRARRGDEISALLYKVVVYGASLRVVLWLLAGIFGALFFWQVSHAFSDVLAIFASALLIWIGFVWLPESRVSKFGETIAARLAPILAWLMNLLQPILGRVTQFVSRHRPVTIHTGLYERADLVDLLDRQQVTADNRIEKAELELAQRALTFSDKTVRDSMTPRRVVKALAADETIGPVLMDELHAGSHSRFPVYGDKPDNIVGTLYLRDLLKIKAGGKVSAAMREDVCYVHEEQPLWDALQAIIKTHHHLLIVVNSFEEYVGVITAEDVFEQIIGQPILDEFDQYDDLRAVAARHAQVEHAKHVKDETEPVQAEETVVESDNA